jgi:hypothetical protein
MDEHPHDALLQVSAWIDQAAADFLTRVEVSSVTQYRSRLDDLRNIQTRVSAAQTLSSRLRRSADVRVIEVDFGLVVALYRMSRLLVATVPSTRQQYPMIDDPASAGRLLRADFSSLRFGVAPDRLAAVGLSEEERRVADRVLYGCLLFLLSHEYGHELQRGPGPHPLLLPSSEALAPQEEYAADVIGLLMLMDTEPSSLNRSMLLAASGVFLLVTALHDDLCFACAPSTHPRPAERWDWLKRAVLRHRVGLSEGVQGLLEVIASVARAAREVPLFHSRRDAERYVEMIIAAVPASFSSQLFASPELMYWDSVYSHSPDAGGLALGQRVSHLGGARVEEYRYAASGDSLRQTGLKVADEMFYELMWDEVAVLELRSHLSDSMGNCLSLQSMRRCVRDFLARSSNTTAKAIFADSEATRALEAVLHGRFSAICVDMGAGTSDYLR